MHYKIQAAMRENQFPPEDLKYLGEREGTHWYLIANEHIVTADEIEGFDEVIEDGYV